MKPITALLLMTFGMVVLVFSALDRLKGSIFDGSGSFAASWAHPAVFILALMAFLGGIALFLLEKRRVHVERRGVHSR